MKRLALFVALTACTKVASEDILTHGMNAQIEARGGANGGTTVSTTLYLGSPSDLNFVELSSGDQLLASSNSVSKPMLETSILNIVGYTATFGTNAADTEFDVAFDRTVDAGAPHSTVTLPAPFDVTPFVDAQSRAGTLTIAWSNSGTDGMNWSITGSCIDSASGAVMTDTGNLVLPAGTVKKRQPTGSEQVPSSCDATLELSRAREGDLDPGYGKGGTITGTQVRDTTFTTAP
jgi:hypothetical protein